MLSLQSTQSKSSLSFNYFYDTDLNPTLKAMLNNESPLTRTKERHLDPIKILSLRHAIKLYVPGAHKTIT